MTLSKADDFFDHAPSGCVMADKDGPILRVNQTFTNWIQTFTNWIGLQAVSCEGRPFSSLLKVGGRIYFETQVAPSLRMHGKVEVLSDDRLTTFTSSMPIAHPSASQ